MDHPDIIVETNKSDHEHNNSAQEASNKTPEHSEQDNQSIRDENVDNFSDAEEEEKEISYEVKAKLRNTGESNIRLNIDILTKEPQKDTTPKENTPEREKSPTLKEPSFEKSSLSRHAANSSKSSSLNSSCTEKQAKSILKLEKNYTPEKENYHQKSVNSSAEEDLEKERTDEAAGSELSGNISKINVPKIDDDIFEYYSYLREQFKETGNPWEDTEFGDDIKFFGRNGEVSEAFKENYIIEFERPDVEAEEFQFFFCEQSPNVDYEFKIKRGILNDKFFVGAVSMLFKKKEEYFTNLILDFENIKENIRAGFCGFTFFINGEWINVTVDTRLPCHQTEEVALSSVMSNKSSFWLSLFEKAYAKVFKTYDVLNSISIKNTLVDLTGGVAKKIQMKENMDEQEKKNLFEEIRRCISHKYLIGSMRFEETSQDYLDESKSDQDQADEEEILTNSIYSILDVQEAEGFKLIYLVNNWNKGKWTKAFNPDDEIWDTNKAFTEKLQYQVSHNDGTFWMAFDDWLINFNTLYYCRIFPESWSQFCIKGEWVGQTSGGAPQKDFKEPWMPLKVNNDKNAGGNNVNPSKSIMQQKFSVLDKTSSKDISSSLKKKSTQFSIKSPGRIHSNLKVGLIPVDERGEYGESKQDHGHFPNLSSSIFQKKTTKLMNKPTITSVKSSSKGMVLPPIRETTQITHATSNVLNTSTLNKTNLSAFKGTQAVSVTNVSRIHRNPIDDWHQKELAKRVIITDTEDRWFMNPQYKLEIRQGTKLIISLLQENKKLNDIGYLKCNFMIIFSKGRLSRVWDLKEDHLIKKASDDEDRKKNREILVHLDYNEIYKIISGKTKRKIINKGEKIHINVVPYIEYYNKYDIEKKGNNMRQFKPVYNEAPFWLRIFSSEDIYVNELPKPYESVINSQWVKEVSAGGARYVKDQNKRNKVTENPYWPINPQYLLKFDQNIAMKVILRKVSGHFSNEEANVGMLITKPTSKGNTEESIKNLIKVKNLNMNKVDQIERVLDSTNKILESKPREEIFPKTFINSSEWIVESSYSNSYCASLFMKFNRIDSPLIIIPTLEYPEIPFEYELSVYSNKPTELIPLNNENTKILISDWKESNAGGCHLVQELKKKSKDEDHHYGKKVVTWLDNPKFHITFESKDRNSPVEFEIVLSRSESIWRKKIANSIVNSMIGIYIFKFDKDRLKDNWINQDRVEFMPKNEISYTFADSKAESKGYVIMPATYGQNVVGPFSLMVKCSTKFNITPLDVKKI